MPIGMPGWPELAFSTASMARKRIALAMSLWLTDVAIMGSAAVIGAFPTALLSFPQVGGWRLGG
jgi:hypothetical protein